MPNVIVADNDLVVRGVLRSLLENVGQTVFLAASGQEVLDVATRVRAGLVLLDLNMPRLNGFLTCEKLRRLPDYASVPIAILSAYDGPRSKRAAVRVGATLFL